MRDVVVNTFLTLDGVMQAPGGPQEDPTGGFEQGGWSVRYWDDVMNEAMGALMSVPSELLLGRKTYEIFAAHWPHVDERGDRGGEASGVDDPAAAVLNAARKWVASRTLKTLTWNNSVLLEGDVADAVAKLKAEDGPVLSVQGSSDLLQTLLRHDLVDEFHIWTFPVVVGEGKRLFGAGAMPAGMQLVDSSRLHDRCGHRHLPPGRRRRAGLLRLRGPDRRRGAPAPEPRLTAAPPVPGWAGGDPSRATRRAGRPAAGVRPPAGRVRGVPRVAGAGRLGRGRRCAPVGRSPTWWPTWSATSSAAWPAIAMGPGACTRPRARRSPAFIDRPERRVGDGLPPAQPPLPRRSPAVGRSDPRRRLADRDLLADSLGVSWAGVDPAPCGSTRLATSPSTGCTSGRCARPSVVRRRPSPGWPRSSTSSREGSRSPSRRPRRRRRRALPPRRRTARRGLDPGAARRPAGAIADADGDVDARAPGRRRGPVAALDPPAPRAAHRRGGRSARTDRPRPRGHRPVLRSAGPEFRTADGAVGDSGGGPAHAGSRGWGAGVSGADADPPGTAGSGVLCGRLSRRLGRWRVGWRRRSARTAGGRSSSGRVGGWRPRTSSDGRSMLQRMVDGDLYLADDPAIGERARRAHLRMEAFNASSVDDPAGRRRLLEELLGAIGEGSEIRPPLYVDYGTNITDRRPLRSPTSGWWPSTWPRSPSATTCRSARTCSCSRRPTPSTRIRAGRSGRPRSRSPSATTCGWAAASIVLPGVTIGAEHRGRCRRGRDSGPAAERGRRRQPRPRNPRDQVGRQRVVKAMTAPMASVSGASTTSRRGRRAAAPESASTPPPPRSDIRTLDLR